MSPRYCELERLQSWADGTQYQGRPDWFSQSVPLWERAPCIVYPVVRIASQSNCDLVLGEGRFPTFGIEVETTSKRSEGTEDETSPDADEKPERALEDFLSDWHKLAKFRSVSRELFQSAQECGTGVLLQGVRRGLPFAESLPAKWCNPTWSDDDGELLEVEILYPYLERYRSGGKWEVRAMVYRRLITRQRDIVYFPAEGQDSDVDIEWRENPKASAAHNLGFVPIVWYAHMRGCQPVNVIDGQAIHATVTDEIQAHDIARSQWHRGALYSEPQRYEIGVTKGYNPTGEGRTALVPTTEFGGPSSPNNPIRGGFIDPTPAQKARLSGPGHVWQYESPETKVGAIVYPSDALKAQQDNCSDLKLKIQESMAVVFLDPDNIKFAATTSGKALEAIKQKQIDRCDLYRDDLTDNYFTPALLMQLRIARKLGEGVKIEDVSEVLGYLGSEELSVPQVCVKWGNYFKPDPDEQQKIVTMTRDCLDAGLISKRVAVEQVAPIFGVEDIESLLSEIEKESQEQASAEDDSLMRQAEAYHAAAVKPKEPSGPVPS